MKKKINIYWVILNIVFITLYLSVLAFDNYKGDLVIPFITWFIGSAFTYNSWWYSKEGD